MLQSEVDSLRSQLGGGGRIGLSTTDLQIQQMSQALAQSLREKDELIAFITKMPQQQRISEEVNAMNDHSRGRFNEVNSANGVYHQQQQQQTSLNGNSTFVLPRIPSTPSSLSSLSLNSLIKLPDLSHFSIQLIPLVFHQ